MRWGHVIDNHQTPDVTMGTEVPTGFLGLQGFSGPGS